MTVVRCHSGVLVPFASPGEFLFFLAYLFLKVFVFISGRLRSGGVRRRLKILNDVPLG